MPVYMTYEVAVVMSVVVVANDGTREEFKVDSFGKATSPDKGVVHATANALQQAAIKAMQHAEAVHANEERRLA